MTILTWFVPNIWPIGNAINIILLDESQITPFDNNEMVTKNGNKNNKSEKGEGLFGELISRQIKQCVYLLIGIFVYYTSFPSYNSIMNNNSFKWWFKWSIIIILRDQFLMYSIYGFWHYLLYESKYKQKMFKLKFNKEYPTKERWNHDKMWTLNGGFISSLLELFILYIYKSFPYLLQTYFWNETFYISILWICFIDIWRQFHFYIIHRAMHPWFKKDSKLKSFDFGVWLYKICHYLHHESYNPGPWTGLSMHPIEHLIYYSCYFVPMIFGIPQHGIHLLTIKWNSNISPISGHDGYANPSGGNYYHYLHHAHFECNYGTKMMDQLFGTFQDGKKYHKKKK
eukprot:4758_1